MNAGKERSGDHVYWPMPPRSRLPPDVEPPEILFVIVCGLILVVALAW